MMNAHHVKSNISKQHFNSLAAFLYRSAGIYLKDSPKNYNLIYNRTLAMCRKNGIQNFDDLIERLRVDPIVQSMFVAAMTTNTTAFFRESNHFDYLAEYVANILQKGTQEPIRIWCAACSTGEEAFTMAMVMQDLPTINRRGFKILATDLNPEVLARGKSGIISDRAKLEIPSPYFEKYVMVTKGPQSNTYQMANQIRDRIHFARFNLNLDYPFQKKFDVIFCRNVLIYFDHKDGMKIVDKMVQSLNRGGLLFLGHCEANLGHHPELSKIAPSVYQRT